MSSNNIKVFSFFFLYHSVRGILIESGNKENTFIGPLFIHLIVYITLKGLEEQLPENQFIKVHKSFIVNRSKIKSIEGNMINIGSEKITISQNLREKVLNEILKDKMIKR